MHLPYVHFLSFLGAILLDPSLFLSTLFWLLIRCFPTKDTFGREGEY